MPDLFHETQHGKVCFTDGVGVCGARVARQAAKSFEAEEGVDANPSAIQIRCGGIKGVLGVWPMLCLDDDVRFRLSQIKFKTDPKTMAFGLNVLRVSVSSEVPAYADRSIPPRLPEPPVHHHPQPPRRADTCVRGALS